MVIIDGSFLLGIAAVLSSLGTLWRIARHHSEEICPRCANCMSQYRESGDRLGVWARLLPQMGEPD